MTQVFLVLGKWIVVAFILIACRMAVGLVADKDPPPVRPLTQQDLDNLYDGNPGLRELNERLKQPNR